MYLLKGSAIASSFNRCDCPLKNGTSGLIAYNVGRMNPERMNQGQRCVLGLNDSNFIINFHSL